MTIGIYAGSFDPITNGHLSIIEQAQKAFDTVLVAVGINRRKDGGWFSVEQRVQLIKEVAPRDVMVESFEGLLLPYCIQVGLNSKQKVAIVRGLRAVSDFESEMAIADANRKINARVPTVFIPTEPEHAFISSSAARELVSYKGGHEALQKIVPGPVANALIAQFGPSVVL